VSTFYSNDGEVCAAAAEDLFAAIAPRLPTDVHIQSEASGDIIEDTTGVLTGEWAGSTGIVHTGADGSTYPALAGLAISWETSTILDGHRIQGRTFIVPMGGGAYDSDGSINAANLTAIQAGADAFVTAMAGALYVWHRPRKARAANGTIPAVTARDGGHAVVTSAVVHDRVVVLRSRRA